MIIKKCTCGKTITTKNAKRVIRDEMGLYFNCPFCHTTLFIKDKNFTYDPSVDDDGPSDEDWSYSKGYTQSYINWINNGG